MDDDNLKYKLLGNFDREMIHLIRSKKKFQETQIEQVWDNQGDQILVFKRDDLLFVFNFHPNKSYADYGFLTEKGSYKTILNTDSMEFGGFGIIDETVQHFTIPDELYQKEGKEWLKVYIPSRTAFVLQKQK
jgi:1,4-alpha-glucan branching enzyme